MKKCYHDHLAKIEIQSYHISLNFTRCEWKKWQSSTAEHEKLGPRWGKRSYGFSDDGIGAEPTDPGLAFQVFFTGYLS
jgi:hypothetical protein